MKLYHGSNVTVDKPRILPPKRLLDFGRGFYLTVRTVNQYLEGYFPEDVAVRLLLPEKLKDQFAFKTERALKKYVSRRRSSMNRLAPETIDYYDSEVVRLMVDKYGYTPMQALKEFACSETHVMLEDENCGMTEFGAGALLEIWEAENITGNPRNSIYIRGD